MVSQIDPTVPVFGTPTTASVRANFLTAANEISALQQETASAPFLPLSGGRMQGPMYLYNDPTDAMMPATKGYVDAGGGSGGGGIPEAPADSQYYGRYDGSWQPVLSMHGGTLIGDLILFRDATNPLGAVTLEQLEAVAATILADAPNDANTYGRSANSWAPVMPIAGGQVTGSLGVGLAIPTSTLAPAAPSLLVAGSVSAPDLNINAYRNASGWAYTANGFAARITQDTTSGVLYFNLAPSGSAGATITFANPIIIDRVGNISNYGSTGIPTDSNAGTINSNRFTTVPNGSYNFNLYAGSTGLKALVAGYAAWLGQSTNGSVYLQLFPSLAAGGAASTATGSFTFDQNSNLTLSGGQGIVYCRQIAINPTNGYEWTMYCDGSGNHIQNHRSNWYQSWSTNNGTWAWISPTCTTMQLDGSGNLTINGTLYSAAGQIGGNINCGSISSPGNISCANLSAASQISGGTLFASGGNQVIGPGGSGRIYQFQGNYYLGFDNSSGNTSYYLNGSLIWMMRNDSLAYNQWGAVGGNGAYQNISDPRAKKDVAQATVGLAEILALKPIRFTRIAQPVKPDPKMPQIKPVNHLPEIGFDAVQVREHLPEAVAVAGFTLPDGSGGIDSDDPSLAVMDSAIVATLVNAMKEVDARLRALEGTPA